MCPALFSKFVAYLLGLEISLALRLGWEAISCRAGSQVSTPLLVRNARIATCGSREKPVPTSNMFVAAHIKCFLTLDIGNGIGETFSGKRLQQAQETHKD